MNFDLQKEILRRLPVDITLQCQSVCKAWRDFVRSPSCWVHRQSFKFKVTSSRNSLSFFVGSKFIEDCEYDCVDIVYKFKDAEHIKKERLEQLKCMLHFAQYAQILHINRRFVHLDAPMDIFSLLTNVKWRYNTFKYVYLGARIKSQNEDESDLTLYTKDFDKQEGLLRLLIQSRLNTIVQHPQMTKCAISISEYVILPSNEEHVDLMKMLFQLGADTVKMDYFKWTKKLHGECRLLSEVSANVFDDELAKNRLRMVAETRYKSLGAFLDLHSVTFCITKCETPPYTFSVVEEKFLDDDT